jgi:hypothetical protein
MGLRGMSDTAFQKKVYKKSYAKYTTNQLKYIDKRNKMVIIDLFNNYEPSVQVGYLMVNFADQPCSFSGYKSAN